MDKFLAFLKTYLWVTLIIAVAFFVVAWIFMRPVKAGELDMRFDRTKCYSWEGGHKSSGSFTQCDSSVVVVAVPGKEVVRETVRVERVEVPVVAQKECLPPPKVVPKKPKQRYTCDGKWVPIPIK